jgi:hypothetical protein
MPTDDTKPGPGTPKAPAGLDGVIIAVAAPMTPRGPVDLSGVFQLKGDEVVAFDGQPHRGLTMVVTSAEGAILGTPFRERVFFEDDLERARDAVRGYFRLRIVPPDQPIPAGPLWISVSLGEHLSNVVELVGHREGAPR